MKLACVVFTVLIALAIMAVCVMVKFATDITLEEKKKELVPGRGFVHSFSRDMGVIALSDNASLSLADRFPFVAAITRNSSGSWAFACFGSVVLVKWVVTSAHCRVYKVTRWHRRAGTTHRVLVYHHFARNISHTYPIMFWRLHEKFNISNPSSKYDIAVAKINIDFHPFSIKSSTIDENRAAQVEASVWKTVSTMDRKLYLTNDFAKFEVRIVPASRCYETYGIEAGDSLVCVDLSDHEDCFVHEFGPIYAADKLVGVLAVKPKDCDLKLAIFTNVSYYTDWVLKSTRITYYG